MSGGGGGSSGSVDYPDYMKEAHGNMLNGQDIASGETELTVSVISAMNTAYSGNPYTGLTTVDPDTPLADILTKIDAFGTLVTALNYATDFPAIMTVALAQNSTDTSTLDTTTLDTTTLDTTTLDTATLDSITIDETRLDDDIDAFDALLTAQLDDTALPAYKAGLLNIGAVNTSGYAVGEAILIAAKNREVVKYGTALRIELQKSIDQFNTQHKLQRREIDAQHQQKYREITARHQLSFRDITSKLQMSNRDSEVKHKLQYRASEMAFKIDRMKRVHVSISTMLGELMREVDLSAQVAQLYIQAKAQYIIAKKEEFNEQVDLDEREARWYLDTFQYGVGVLGGIAPAGPSAGPKRPSAAVSALAGGISGAATGASIGSSTDLGSGYGAAIGAVVGAGLGYFSN